MNAYATCYRCNRLVLIYPASEEYASAKFTTFDLMTEERPWSKIVAVDVRELAYGNGSLGHIQDLIPHDSHRME